MTPLAVVHRLPSPARFARRLDHARREAIDDVLARRAEDVRAVASGLAGGDADAVERGAARVLDELRGVGGAAARVDAHLRSGALEWLDRDDVPAPAKRALVRWLHGVNVVLGSYGVWTDAIFEALGADAEGARVHDVAAGTGGFARWLAGTPRGRRLRLTSSDVDPGYVAIGAARARRLGLDVAFEARDALDLARAPEVDLFVCTQAAHHLTPGQVVRMIAGGVARARRGLLVVDLYRSVANVVLTGGALSLIAPPLLHDGVLSVRRSWQGCELELLARLAGASPSSRARLASPAFVALHAIARHASPSS